MPGDDWQKFAGLRTLLAYMWSHPGKQLLFMGGEFGQGAEWAEERPLDWWLLDNAAEGSDHLGLQALVRELNHVYKSHSALWARDTEQEGFAWIDANDASGNVLSYLRYGKSGEGEPVPVLACVVNFSGNPHENYRLGLPHAGPWREVLNTDAFEYGGSGVGNMGRIEATNEPMHAQPASAVMRVPPLGVVWFAPEQSAEEFAEEGAPEDFTSEESVPEESAEPEVVEPE